MAKHRIEKTEAGSIDQCQGIGNDGQCLNKKLDGSDFCSVHGGNRAAQVAKKRSLSTYQLAKYQVRLNDMANHDNLKNLKDEIGILRIVMEEILNKCPTELDLMQRAPQIADLAMKIGKLVEACAKLDKLMSQYISKNDAVQLGMEIVASIGSHIQDVEVLDSISEEICDIIERLASEE